MSTHDDDRPVDPALVDEALRRVAAADPAATAQLDTERLHATLAAATGVTFPADELAAARARRLRRTRWLSAAAAVVALGVTAGGGYAVGAAGGGSSSVAAPISLDRDAAGGAGDVESGDMGVMGQEESLDGGAGAFAPERLAGDSIMPAWGFGGRQVFHAEGLSDEGGEQAAWAFDAQGVYSEATLREVAEVFGVTGALSDEYGLTLGSVDGTGPSVTLSPDGQASVAYHDPTRDPWACETRSALDQPMSGEGVDGTAGEVVEPDRGVVGTDCDADAPSEKKAVDTARDTLEALGLDAGDFTYEATTDSGRGTNVLATLVVDGQATEAVWNLHVMSDGVQSAYGPLAPVVALGDYDVVSPREAVDRLNDPRFGATATGIWPLAGARAVDGLPSKVADQPTVPPTPRGGAPIVWPVTQVAITDARLGVAVQHLEDGAVVLVPAYELSDDTGTTWSVIAVVEDQLDLTR